VFIVDIIILYHLTICDVCKQVVAISDGHTDKYKLIVGEWKTHTRFCTYYRGELGTPPTFTRLNDD